MTTLSDKEIQDLIKQSQVNRYKIALVRAFRANFIASDDEFQSKIDKIKEISQPFIDEALQLTYEDLAQDKPEKLILRFNKAAKYTNPYPSEKIARKRGVHFKGGKVVTVSNFKDFKEFEPTEIKETSIDKTIRNIIRPRSSIRALEKPFSNLNTISQLAKLDNEEILKISPDWRDLDGYEEFKDEAQAFLKKFGFITFSESIISTPHSNFSNLNEMRTFIKNSTESLLIVTEELSLKPHMLGLDKSNSFEISHDPTISGSYSPYRKQISINISEFQYHENDNDNMPFIKEYNKRTLANTFVHEWMHSLDNRMHQEIERIRYQNLSFLGKQDAINVELLESPSLNNVSSTNNKKIPIPKNTEEQNVINAYQEFKKLTEKSKFKYDLEAQHFKEKLNNYKFKTNFNLISKEKWENLPANIQQDFIKTGVQDIIKQDLISIGETKEIISLLEKHNLDKINSQSIQEEINYSIRKIFGIINNTNNDSQSPEDEQKKVREYIDSSRQEISSLKASDPYAYIQKEDPNVVTYDTKEEILDFAQKYYSKYKKAQEKQQLTRLYKNSLKEKDKEYYSSNEELLARNTESHITMTIFPNGKEKYDTHIFTSSNSLYNKVSLKEKKEFLVSIRYVIGNVFGKEVLTKSTILNKEEGKLQYAETIEIQKARQLQAYSFGRKTADMIKSIKTIYDNKTSYIKNKTINILDNIKPVNNDLISLPSLTMRNSNNPMDTKHNQDNLIDDNYQLNKHHSNEKDEKKNKL